MRAFKNIFFLVFVFGVNLVFAQTFKVDLSWNNQQQNKIGTDTIYRYNFTSASYGTSFGNLPVFVYQKNLGKQAIEAVTYNVEIENTETKPFSFNRSFADAENIPATFKIKTFVSSARGENILEVHVLPLKKNSSNQVEALTSFELKITPEKVLQTKAAGTSGFADNSVLASGKWVKMSIPESGIYKLTYGDISSQGIDPKNVRIFGNGGKMLDVKFVNRQHDDLVENAVWREWGNDGEFNSGDYILFYAQGPDTWKYNTSKKIYEHTQHRFDEKAYYFMTSDAGVGKYITPQNTISQSPNKTSDTFDDYAFIEPENENLVHSGSQWFSDIMYPGEEVNESFTFPNIITNENAKLSTRVVGRTFHSSSSFSMYADDATLGSIILPNSPHSLTSYYAQDGTSTKSFRPTSDNINIRLKYSSYDASGTGWYDYIRVIARRQLLMVDDQMDFRDAKTLGAGNITRFNIGNTNSALKVIDVTDCTHPIEITGSHEGGTYGFTTTTDELKQFVAFYPDGSFQKPVMEGTIENQNLHATPQTDYLIVVHPDFTPQAERLAELHRSKGLTVTVTELPLIYNEFSSGQRDITAIRWYAKMLYNRYAADEQLKYLLLFGNGTYDNRINSTFNNPNYIPTYQSVNSLHQSDTYVSDDYFALMDNTEGTASSTDRIDLGIGRLPVQSIQQAEQVVSKIENYMRNGKCTPWKNSIVFIGDDEDSNEHLNNAEKLSAKVARENPDFNISKIYFDAYKQVTLSSGPTYPDVNQLIDNAINQGVVILNYTGHGGVVGLADEKVVTMAGIKNYANFNNLPVWMTATCEFSRYDLKDFTTAGEEVLLNPNGGGIALFTTTRLVYSGDNYEINRNFYDYAFSINEDGERNRMGDIIRLTKKKTGTGVNKRKFSLLGDPALDLVYPTGKIIASEINGMPVDEYTDTLKALSTVTISGYIENYNGEFASGFNGTIYPRVFDKMVTKTTIANDKYSRVTDFKLWENMLFSGKATVKNGEWSFSFNVPKDIDYNYGIGRIALYACSDEAGIEAHGHYENFYVGGFNENHATDNEGPAIDLFLNSPDFKDGDKVNPNPLMIANISDLSGINKTGGSIGHDIIAVLDNDKANTIVLNDYYEAGEDFSSGQLRFKLQNLEEGKHTLFFRVWDIHNNSSVQTITFEVKNNINPGIDALLAYPNPAKYSTNEIKIIFNHDRPDELVEITVDIYDLKGNKINTLLARQTNSTIKTEPIVWDMKTAAGNKAPRGAYIYKVTLTDTQNTSTTSTQKLIIL